ncbi:MAG: MotA/TolQ/ExbB proton channel family protein [Flavobacteriales bacterium]|nr:MotA/TolQ/ExbB proton channel family protein [Flavobacteriales bacterium]
MLNNILLQISVAADSLATTVDANGDIIPQEESISVLQLLYDGGLFIMLPLAVLSVIAVYIIVERIFAVREASKSEDNFMNQIRDFIHDGKIDAAQSLCQSSDTPISRMIEKGVSRIGKPLTDIKEAIENVGNLEIGKMEKGISTLGTIAGAAPMIGFLGTVIGMIVTFHDMFTAGNEVQVSDLAGGIMQAMVTTAAGLVIGIIAYVGYNVIVARVQKVIYGLEATTIEFMDVLNEPSK